MKRTLFFVAFLALLAGASSAQSNASAPAQPTKPPVTKKSSSPARARTHPAAARTAPSAMPNVSGGSGSVNAVPKFSSPSALQNSALTENNGNVGIGITSPTMALDVSGTALFRASGANSPSLSFGDSTGNSSIVLGQAGTAATSNFGIMHGGAWRFSITSSGLVGIGTTAPSSLLTVAGDLRLTTSGRLLFPDGTIQTTAAAGSSGTPVLVGNNVFTGQQSFNLSDAVNTTVSVYNSATSGSANVVNVETDSPTGTGIYVIATGNATGGTATAVIGRSAAPQGAGLLGDGQSTSGANFGVVGIARSTSGTGVQGQALATTGTTYGVYGSSAGNANAAGVYGTSTSTTQQAATYGVWGTTLGQYGVGVFGYSQATSGTTLGVFGRVDSASGIAGQFTNTASGGVILAGSNGSGRVFHVDNSGNLYLLGMVHIGSADFAETMAAAPAPESFPYQPGDVLVIDELSDRRVRRSSEPYSTAVIGIYSARPGVLGAPHGASVSQADLPAGAAGQLPVAMVGIVPVKASAENGPIRRGDLLVTAATPGCVMRGTDRARLPGAIVGKALQPLESGTGLIEAAVALQ